MNRIRTGKYYLEEKDKIAKMKKSEKIRNILGYWQIPNTKKLNVNL